MNHVAHTGPAPGWLGPHTLRVSLSLRLSPLRASVSPLALVLVLPIIGSCGGPADASDDFDVDAVPPLELVEEVRIGSVDDPVTGFGTVRAIDLDDAGNVYVLEGQAMEVRVFDASGTHVRTFGRQGEGPGEFQFPTQLGVVGDTVWVGDLTATRTTFFTRAGELVGSVQVRTTTTELIPGVSVRLRPSAPRPAGGFNSTWSIGLPSDPPPDTIMIPRVVFDSSGTVVDTLGYQPFNFATITAPPITVAGQTVNPVVAPSHGPVRASRYEKGVIVIDAEVPASDDIAHFTVTRMTEREDTLAHQRYRYTPMPFDDATIDSLLAIRVRSYADRGLDADIVAAALRDALDAPPFQPPVSRVEVAEDETLWLAREADAEAMRRWLVISPAGIPRGEALLDHRTRWAWARGDVVWVIELDEFDIPWVVRYRVEGG